MARESETIYPVGAMLGEGELKLHILVSAMGNTANKFIDVTDKIY